MSNALAAMMAYHQQSRQYPGAMALVEREGRVLCREVSGHLHGYEADAQPGAPMHDGARFRIASLSKAIVSVTVLRLVESGSLDLDSPVGDYLPVLGDRRLADGRSVQRQPSLRDCLRHTIGLPYAPEIRNAQVRQQAAALGLHRAAILSREAFLAALAPLGLDAEPGTRFQYGYGTDIAGLIIEKVTGLSLGEALTREILGPLGMTNTGFRADPAEHAGMPSAFAEDLAWHGFSAQFGEADRNHLAGQVPMHSGGGGLISTLDDYARFARMLANGGRLPDGSRLLGEALFAQMLSDQLGPAVDGPYGFTGGGFTFGLAGALRLPYGPAGTAAKAGEFTWSGVTGQTLYVQPNEGWFALMLSSNTATRLAVRLEFRRAVGQVLA